MIIRLESDNLQELIKARIQFNDMLLESPIVKDATSNKGDYVSLEALQEATITIMNKVGLYVEQTTLCENGKEYLVTTLRHISGQYTRSVGYLYEELAGMDSMKAQECGKIMTYKQRYQWRSLLNVGRGQSDAEEAIDHKEIKKAPFNPKGLELWNLMKDHKDIQAQVFQYYKINNTNELPDDKFEEAKRVILAKIAAKK